MLTVGLNDCKGLFEPKRFYDSKINTKERSDIKEVGQYPIRCTLPLGFNLKD